MFGRLFLYELKNSYKFPLVALILAAITSVVCGLTIRFSDSGFLVSASIILFIAAGITLMVSLFTTFYHSLVKSLFSNRAYLVYSIPTKTKTILLAKLLVNILYYVLYEIAIIAVFLLFFKVLTSSKELIHQVSEVLKDYLHGNPVPAILIIVTASITIFLVLIAILTFGAIRHMGMSKGKALLVIIFILVAYVIGTSFLNSQSLVSLYWNPETDNFYLMNYYQLSDLLSEKGEFISTIKIFNFFNNGLNLVLIVCGYFFSKHVIQNKLDLY